MVSGRLAHTGYVTLIRHEIQTLCKAIPGESQNMKEIKRLILTNINRRLPDNDITRLSTLLDPGTKDAIVLSREQKVSEFTHTHYTAYKI